MLPEFARYRRTFAFWNGTGFALALSLPGQKVPAWVGHAIAELRRDRERCMRLIEAEHVSWKICVIPLEGAMSKAHAPAERGN